MSKRVSIKTGLVGLAHDGQAVLNAVRGIGCIELAAVAGVKAPEFAARLGVAGYDDPRSLVVEHDVELVLVAAPAFRTTDTLAAAANRGLPVWRWPPPGRSVEETARVLSTFEAAGCPLVVGHTWTLEAARGLLAEHKQSVGPPTLWQINCLRNDPRHETWQGDQQRAGGGALLHLGFDAIRLIVSQSGLPSQVTAVTLRAPKAALPHTYDTEDIAVTSMHYGGEAIASVVASRTHPVESFALIMQSPTASASLAGDSIVLRLTDGPTHSAAITDRAACLRAQIERFAKAVLAGDPPRCDARELLAAQAVIDAAYLSARTGEPESPARFLDLAALSATP